MKQQAFRLFGAGDKRAASFWLPDSALAHNDTLPNGQPAQTDSVISIGDFHHGIPGPKFTNKTSAGANGQQTGMVDTDFPLFRLADAYLIYVEANIRGGGGSGTTALVTSTPPRACLRKHDGRLRRASCGRYDSGERGRELMFEAQRRTDLVRSACSAAVRTSGHGRVVLPAESRWARSAICIRCPRTS